MPNVDMFKSYTNMLNGNCGTGTFPDVCEVDPLDLALRFQIEQRFY